MVGGLALACLAGAGVVFALRTTRRLAEIRDSVSEVRNTVLELQRIVGDLANASTQQVARADALLLTMTARSNEARVWSAAENAGRDRLPSTEQILDALSLSAGQRVADVGTGGGYFARRIASLVGDTGVVVAADVDGAAIERLAETVRLHGPSNVRPLHLPDAERLPIAAPFDRILVVDVYCFSTNDEAGGRRLLSAWARALRPGGLLVVFHQFVHRAGWRPEPGSAPVVADQPDAAVLSRWVPVELELKRSERPVQRPDQVYGELEEDGYLLVLERRTEAGPGRVVGR